MGTGKSTSRAAVLQRLRLTGDILDIFLGLTRGAALLVLAILSGVILALIIGSMPALRPFGFGFLYTRGLESGDRAVRRAARRSTAPW